MKWVYIIPAVILILVALALPIVLLFVSPLPENSWLIGVRDMSVIYTAMFMCLGALLFVAMTFILTLILFTLRDHVVPALQKVDDTAKTVRGTATFVSESVVAPIIKVAGAAAGARAMVQTLMRRNPPKPAEKKEA